jgi:hypothetical protein
LKACKKTSHDVINSRGVEKPHILGLFKNVHMQGAQKAEPRGVYENTLSGTVCSATRQMSFFQQPYFSKTGGGLKSAKF